MLKKMVLVAACLLFIGVSAQPTQAFVGGFIVKQVVKQAAKSLGIKFLDRGAEKQCVLWNRFGCAKVAR